MRLLQPYNMYCAGTHWLLLLILPAGEALNRGVQPGLHSDAAAISAEGLWPLPDILLLRAVEEGGQDRHTRAPAVRPRPCELHLLDVACTWHISHLDD